MNQSDIDEIFDDGFKAGRDSILPEIKAVLIDLDHLAKVWGDEGVFRRCRDRLRELTGEKK